MHKDRYQHHVLMCQLFTCRGDNSYKDGTPYGGQDTYCALTSSCVLEERSSVSKDCSSIHEERSLKGEVTLIGKACSFMREDFFSMHEGCFLRWEESSLMHETAFSSSLSSSATLSSVEGLDSLYAKQGKWKGTMHYSTNSAKSNALLIKREHCLQ